MVNTEISFDKIITYNKQVTKAIRELVNKEFKPKSSHWSTRLETAQAVGKTRCVLVIVGLSLTPAQVERVRQVIKAYD